jgi:hypothetical protein
VGGLPQTRRLGLGHNKVLQRAASVSKCPATQRRVLRFSGEVQGHVAYICTGNALH